MPYYEYRCNGCGHQYEKLQRITDDSRPPCEACGSGDVSRLVSHTSFVLKGSGWYVTDYGRGKGGSSSSAGPKTGDNASSASTSEPAAPASASPAPAAAPAAPPKAAP